MTDFDPSRPPRQLDWLIALSLATTCFLAVTRELVFADTADRYWLPDYTRASYVAALLNLVVVTGLAWAGLRILRAARHRGLRSLVGVAGVLALVPPLNFIRTAVGVDSNALYWLRVHGAASTLAALAFGAVVVVIVRRYHRLVRATAALALLLISPFALSSLLQLAWGAAWCCDGAADTAPAAPVRRPLATRIVWLLFDELDYRLALAAPPAGLTLGGFDALSGQALSASRAMSGSYNTREAVPALLLGREVTDAEPTGPRSLALTLTDQTPVSWDGSDSWFADVAALGARTAISGYYHPYCRLFARYVEWCTWHALNTYQHQATRSVQAEMAGQLKGILPLARRINAVQTYDATLDAVPRLAANADYDVVFAHLSVPHGPDISEPGSDDGGTLLVTSPLGYFGNLRLADHLLSRVRTAMESAGVWDSSVVLVTSDHEWRHVRHFDGRRVAQVPFLLKMAEQHDTVGVATPFMPALVIRGLLNAVLSGDVVTAAEAAAWIARHSRR